MEQIRKALQFLREAKEELKKVTWPDRDEVTSYTVVVVIAVIILAVFLWVVDQGLMVAIKQVMK